MQLPFRNCNELFGIITRNCSTYGCRLIGSVNIDVPASQLAATSILTRITMISAISDEFNKYLALFVSSCPADTSTG